MWNALFSPTKTNGYLNIFDRLHSVFKLIWMPAQCSCLCRNSVRFIHTFRWEAIGPAILELRSCARKYMKILSNENGVVRNGVQSVNVRSQLEINFGQPEWNWQKKQKKTFAWIVNNNEISLRSKSWVTWPVRSCGLYGLSDSGPWCCFLFFAATKGALFGP